LKAGDAAPKRSAEGSLLCQILPKEFGPITPKVSGMKNTVLITGASSGFGKAATRLFAKNGWNVAATMRRPEMEQDLVGLNDVLVARLDVQDRASITEAIEAGVARFGRIEALINNAGFGLSGLFEATPRE
jgi:NADP-dependent 3-hydroxy acid dehydrogenase YdfG